MGSRYESDDIISQLQVDAVCVFIDLRGSSQMTTLNMSHNTIKILNDFRNDCLGADISGSKEPRDGWKHEAIEQYFSARKGIFKHYQNSGNYGFSYRMVKFISDITLPLFFFHKLIGDGILVVFEVNSQDTMYNIKYQNKIFEDYFKLRISSGIDNNPDLIIKDAIRWATQLSRWRAKAINGVETSDLRIGIGVSFGSVIRTTFLDPKSHLPVMDYVGSALNRAARLESLAKPSGGVFDVTCQRFRDAIREAWLQFVHDRDNHRHQQFYFSQPMTGKMDVRGDGQVEIYACGEIGKVFLFSADRLLDQKDKNGNGSANFLEDSFKLYKKLLESSANSLSQGLTENSKDFVIIPEQPDSKMLGIPIGDKQLAIARIITTKQPSCKGLQSGNGRPSKAQGCEFHAQWQASALAMQRTYPENYEGGTVRLVGLKDGKLGLRKSGYFWAACQQFKITSRAATSPFSAYELILNPLTGDIFGDNLSPGILDTKQSILGNHIGVNIFLYDKLRNGDYAILFQERSALVYVKGKYVPTGSGTLAWEDFGHEYNPLLQGALRELELETGIRLHEPNLKAPPEFLGLTREFTRLGQPDSFYACQCDLDKIIAQYYESSTSPEAYEVLKMVKITIKKEPIGEIVEIEEFSKLDRSPKQLEFEKGTRFSSPYSVVTIGMQMFYNHINK